MAAATCTLLSEEDISTEVKEAKHPVLRMPSELLNKLPVEIIGFFSSIISLLTA
jgi:hypothetical protein